MVIEVSAPVSMSTPQRQELNDAQKNFIQPPWQVQIAMDQIV
jgi:hypothetical protein